MNRLTEMQLRVALKHHLSQLGGDAGAGRLIEELAIERGAARVDVAYITSHLEGFEIKSDFDTFDRMSNQIHAYNRVFEKISLVTTAAWLADAIRLMPSWWGLIVADQAREGDDAIGLRIVREATRNPMQVPLSIAKLLWKEEALDVLARHGDKLATARWSNHKLHSALTERLADRAMQALVSEKLRARSEWRTRPPLTRGDDSSRHGAKLLDCLI